MQSPDISIAVCMAHFNKGHFTLEAVRSVLAQAYTNFQLVLVDDASTDGSSAMLLSEASRNPRLIFHSLPVHSGASVARNKAFELSTADYVFFMDSDDLMPAGALAYMANSIASKPNKDFVAFPMELFHSTPGDMKIISNIPKHRCDLVRFLERDQPWLLSGPLWKRSFFDKIGGFDADLISQQDYDLHVRALVHQPQYCYLHEQPVCFYRQGVESEARKRSQSLEGLLQRAEMLRKHAVMIEEAKLRNSDTDRALSAYLLDLAQMLRWHKNQLKGKSTQEALAVWMIAHEHQLCDARTYSRGMGYIRFKHNMLWNRFPVLQSKMEAAYRKSLTPLFDLPESTLCRKPTGTLSEKRA